MPIVYFDSSALVKLCVEEDGSDVAASIWDSCDETLSSRLAYPEMRAAIAAAARNHRLSGVELRRAERLCEQMWRAVQPIDLTSAVAADAGHLAAARGLRGADAVHLASALATSVPRLFFAAWDIRLRVAAQAVGLLPVPRFDH